MPRPWAGSTRRARLPGNWRTIRARVLERDGGRCYICKGLGADGVDHVVAGDDHRDAPPFCHRKKTADERPRNSRSTERHPGLR